MNKYNCINCQKKLKCSCFDIDLDDKHAPFCSAECVLDYDERNESNFAELSQNFEFKYQKKGYYYPVGFNGHSIECENQFDVKNKKLKQLIKELQENRDLWEKMANDYCNLWKKSEEKLKEK